MSVWKPKRCGFPDCQSEATVSMEGLIAVPGVHAVMTVWFCQRHGEQMRNGEIDPRELEHRA